MSFDLITDEDQFKDPDAWGMTHKGNPICTVEIEGAEFTVVIFQHGRGYGFLIFDESGGKTWSKVNYPTLEEAMNWAWTRLELLV